MRYGPTPADMAAGLSLAATYIREVRAGIERIWENVLDWEHLPALHEVYFNHVALIDIGGWGWKVELTKRPGSADRRIGQTCPCRAAPCADRRLNPGTPGHGSHRPAR